MYAYTWLDSVEISWLSTCTTDSELDVMM